jgi:branched-chain amino acid transport system ATP-binding protein
MEGECGMGFEHGLLDIKDLTIKFGGLVALSAFSLQMDQGGLIGLIGPNGAGKTTVFNLITGVYAPSFGEVRLQGEIISGRPSHVIARLGVARTFQNIRLFAGLSVFDNLLAAASYRRTRDTMGSILGLPTVRRSEKAIRKQAAELLEFVGLSGAASSQGTALPYGEQRKLEIARALMMQPRLLLLDEPAAGMNPTEKDSLRGLVQNIAQQGIGVLVIEHDMKFVMNLCSQITVLDHGEIICRGNPATVQADPGVIEAYLGSQSAHEPLSLGGGEPTVQPAQKKGD